MHRSVNARSREERDNEKDLNEYLMKIKRGGSRMVLIGDTNGRVGNREIVGVVGKLGKDEVTENAEYLVDMCGKGLFLAHMTEMRRGEQKSLIDYIAVDK